MYKDVTSPATNRALHRKGGSVSVRLRNCFVSLMCGGRLLARGWMKWVM